MGERVCKVVLDMERMTEIFLGWVQEGMVGDKMSVETTLIPT